MLQAVFLVTILDGTLSLVAAIAVARLHWRSDIAPFNRQTNAFKVLAQPSSYVAGPSVLLVRILTVIGYASLGLAVLCLMLQLLASSGRP